MRATADSKELASAVKEAKTVIPAVPDNPAQGAVSVRCYDGRLSLVGYGPRGEISVSIAVEGQLEHGEILVAPKPLEQLVRAVPRGAVTLASDDRGDLEVVSSGSSQGYRLRGVPGSHPILPFRFGDPITLASHDLMSASALVRRSAGSEDNAVQIRVGGGWFVVEATDNYRLSRVNIAVDSDAEFSTVLRHSDLDMAAKAGCSQVAFEDSGSAVRFSRESQVRTVRGLDRPFPPTDSLIKRHAPNSLQVKAEDLAGALRRLEAVTQGGPVNLHAGGGAVLLSGDNPDIGSGTERLEAATEGEEMAFLARSEYLLDVAETESGVITIRYSDDKSALRFEGAGGSVHVVMPLRRA